MVEFPGDKLFGEIEGESQQRKELALMSRISQLGGFYPRFSAYCQSRDPVSLAEFLQDFEIPIWLELVDVPIPEDLEDQLRKRLTKTDLFGAWADAQADVPEDWIGPSGIVFSWAHVGRYMLLYRSETFPHRGYGQFFHLRRPRLLLLLRRLEDFMEEIHSDDDESW